MFCCHKCNHNALMKEARGQNKLFQNVSLLMCYCSFAIGQFLILRTSLKDRLLNCCLKFKTAWITLRVTHKSCVFTQILLFVNFTMLSMEFPIRNFLPFFFQTDGNFLSDYLVTYSGQKSQQITDKKIPNVI